MTYRDTLIALSKQSEAQVQAIYQLFLDGEIDAEECEQLIANAIAANNSRAAALAALSLAATLMVELGRAFPTEVALPPDSDPDRLLNAARTVITVAEDSDVPEAIVGRLGRAEPLETAARSYSAIIKSDPRVTGWIRDTGGDSCQLCEWWSREGRVWEADRPMPIHKGCTCVQLPVVKEN